MLCDRCYGRGLVMVAGRPRPCEECAGQGLSHCCDGDQAQPELVPGVPSYNDGSQEVTGRTATSRVTKPKTAPVVRRNAKPRKRPKVRKNR